MEGIDIVRDGDWFYATKELRDGTDISFWFQQNGSKVYVRDIRITSESFTIKCDTLDDLPAFKQVVK